MELQHIHSVFFIGIGGIGMSALARHFQALGKTVYGYDRTETPLTRQLVAEGMQVHYNDTTDNIPKNIDLVIYTPAVPQTNRQLNYFRQYNMPVYKRSEMLERLTEGKFVIAVAGSHGKTTVTSMIAHLLKDSGYDCTAFMGGISINLNSNYVFGNNNVMVIEADEFDRSFHRLKPDVAVITAIDTDHLDIYGSRENIEQAFLDFALRVQQDGILVLHHSVNFSEKIPQADVFSYGHLGSQAQYVDTGVKTREGNYTFNITSDYGVITGLELHMGGTHNVENAVGAITVARMLGIAEEAIREGLATYRGVKRRFEYVIRRDDLVFIDDYAHHPRELEALIDSVRELYPGRMITAVFQPHLYSRTNDLAADFAEVLDTVDEVILLPIYPAREEPIPGVSSELIKQHMQHTNTRIMEKQELLQELPGRHLEVLLTVGAGDIDQVVQPLKNSLTTKAADHEE